MIFRLRGRSISLLLLCGILYSSLSEGEQPEKKNGNSEIRGRTTREGILLFRSPDGKFAFELDGRVFLDAALYDEDKNEQSNGVELRRGRLGLKTTLWQDWRAELDIDFADNEVDVKDAWISYEGFDSTFLKVGNFKEPFSLEEQTSSKYITFLERALPNALAPSRHIGIGYSTWREKWLVAGGLFGESIGSADMGEDEGYGVTGRVVFRPIRGDSRTVHLGLAGSFRTPEADISRPDRLRFRSRPEAHVDRTRFLDTGRFRDVRHFALYGLEAAAVFGPFSLQGEYIKSSVNRKRGARDVDFDGAYLFATWFISGESRPYVPELGEFGRVIPKRRSGAWEVALRYSTLDLNDLRGGITGGEAKNITLGANWYANPNIRIMANYVIVNHDIHADADGTTRGDDDFRIFQMRFQVHF